MASIYRTPGGGGGSIYRRSGGSGTYSGLPPVSSAPNSPKHRSFFGSALHDVGQAARNTGKGIAGIGPGFYETGKAVGTDVRHHPYDLSVIAPAIIAGRTALHHGHAENPFPETTKKVLKPAAKSYAYKYGPLVHGDVGKTVRRALIEDPLGTAADLATIGTAGAAAGVKLGIIPEAARSIELRSPGRLAGQEAKTIPKGIAGSQFSRHLRIAADKTLKKLPPDFPVLGEVNRYAKALRMREQRSMLHDTLKAQPYLKSERALSREERIAANLIHDYPSRKLLEEYKASLADKPEAGPTLKLLNNKKVLRYFSEPTGKMKTYLEESGKLGDLSAGLAGLAPETVETRRFQQALLLRGAKMGEDGLVAPDKFKLGAPNEGGFYLNQEGSQFSARTAEISRPHDHLNFQNLYHDGRLVGSINYDARPGRSKIYVESIFIDPEYRGSISALRSLVDPLIRDGRPIDATFHNAKLEKIFHRLVSDGRLERSAAENGVPGQTIQDMIAKIRSELAAEGRPEPLYRKHVSVEEKRGIKVGTGGGAPQPAHAPIHQSRAVLAAMGRVAYNIDSLTPAYMKNVKWATYTDRHADLLASGIEVPKGYRLRAGEEFLKRKPSEKIPYTEQTAGDFERNLGGDLGDHLTTKLENDAAEAPNGTRIVIPSKLRQKVVGEYTRSNKAIEWFWNKPTSVWRALVLNLSPRWLVNNVVGNTLMYTVRTAGTGGVRAWLQSMSDLHGPEYVRKLVLGDKEVRNRLTPADMAEVLPEHVQGTFFGTQTPKEGVAGKISKYSPTRPLRAADVGYEKSLRRAIANQVVRKSPEVKARLAAMPAETKSWRAAARQELASNPTLTDRVSAEINNALGDFSNMSQLEQGVIRQFVPFYAWYRAITLVMLKMPLDNPVRANILYNLGKIGEQTQAKGYPYGGAIDLGGGKILKTSGLNPYNTLSQVAGNVGTLAQAAGGKKIDATQRAYAAGGIFNPLITSLLATSVPATVQGLPEYRLAHPPPSKLYSDAGTEAELLAYLGIPIRRLRKP